MTITNDDRIPDYLIDPEPRERDYTIISVDDHVVEPGHVFEGRMPARFADRAPKLKTLDAGTEVDRAYMGLPNITFQQDNREVWEYEGKIFSQIGLNAVVGRKDHAALRYEPSSYSEMRPGCYDPAARVKDMDIAGVWASINFPSSIAGFCGSVFSASDDPELGAAVMRAWNDWLFEEWHQPYPERFIAMGLTWLRDPAVGAAEIVRNAPRGFRAVTMPETPHRIGYPEVHTGYWDPILRACEETDTVVCLHVGSTGMLPLPQSGPRYEKNITLFPAASMLAAVEWLWSGVFQKFPSLKVVLSEGGIGWVPMLLDRLDYVMDHSGTGGLAWSGDLTPGEVLLRNFWFCMLDDPSTLRVLDRIGSQNVMMETDYPHADSTWPDSQALIRRRFADAPNLSDDDIANITYRNAARVFRAPLPDGVS